VIVSNNANNTFSSTVIIALAGTKARDLSEDCLSVGNIDKEIVINFEKLVTVSKWKVLCKLGSLSSEKVRRMNHALSDIYSVN